MTECRHRLTVGLGLGVALTCTRCRAVWRDTYSQTMVLVRALEDERKRTEEGFARIGLIPCLRCDEYFHSYQEAGGKYVLGEPVCGPCIEKAIDNPDDAWWHPGTAENVADALCEWLVRHVSDVARAVAEGRRGPDELRDALVAHYRRS